MRFVRPIALFLPALVLLGAGCQVPVGEGTFERTLTVTGPVNLEVDSGSGDVRITAGAAGRVEVRGEFELYASPAADAERLIEEFKNNPPLEQQGNFIRVGRERRSGLSARVHYTIVVPAETELRATSGSGDLRIRGLRGPARLNAGSGDIVAEAIGGDVEARCGSGDIELRKIAGRAIAQAGSGDLVLEEIGGEARTNTGSGDVLVVRPEQGVRANTGSGTVGVREARGDLAIRTSSGEIQVDGNPGRGAFWDLRSSSGDVRIDVPANASLTLVARARSSRVETDRALEVSERSRRELRGRMGGGDARVVVESSSGHVVVR
jgi:DUF4097 and DUF4098 domain-containing protein YvlB